MTLNSEFEEIKNEVKSRILLERVKKTHERLDHKFASHSRFEPDSLPICQKLYCLK
jgi:hypothetical protein